MPTPKQLPFLNWMWKRKRRIKTKICHGLKFDWTIRNGCFWCIFWKLLSVQREKWTRKKTAHNAPNKQSAEWVIHKQRKKLVYLNNSHSIVLQPVKMLKPSVEWANILYYTISLHIHLDCIIVFLLSFWCCYCGCFAHLLCVLHRRILLRMKCTMPHFH